MHYIIDSELVRGALSVSILTAARRPAVTRAVSRGLTHVQTRAAGQMARWAK